MPSGERWLTVDERVTVVIRSFNEGWALGATLEQLRLQDYTNWELIAFDSGSSDGSVQLLENFGPFQLIQLLPHEYRPGRVINQAMRLSRTELVVFLNADATPQGTDWLRQLLRPFARPGCAASFCRQIPRSGCWALYAHDLERCFGHRRDSAGWDHFFSMVGSGLRKAVWQSRPFREDLQYAEDDDYTRWCRAEGWQIGYVPEAVVIHSHNYDSRQIYRRAFGDAFAIGRAGHVNVPGSWLHSVLLGWMRDLGRDAGYCFRNRRLAELPRCIRLRWQQRSGRWAGFQASRR